MPISPAAPDVLDREFLELRAGLLQIAAQLDRIDRATGTVAGDPRMCSLHQAMEVLMKTAPHRAEQIQLLFSQPYAEDWKDTLRIKEH